MCSCGNEDGCIGLDEGCRCVCHHSELCEKLVQMRKQIRDIVYSNRADVDCGLRYKAALQAVKVGVELLEHMCPCGARPESLATHPHVTNCLVDVILRQIREVIPNERQA